MRIPAPTPVTVAFIVVLVAACGRSRPGGDESLAPPEELPFVAVHDHVVELDFDASVAAAARIRDSVAFTVADGLELSVWATEDLIEDPIAIDIDDNGDVYVTGSSRSGGLLDIRGHPDWRHDALAMRTVNDHLAYFERILAPDSSDVNDWLPDYNGDGSRDIRDLAVNTERLYRLSDRNGDHVADQSEVLVEGFNTPVHDVAGGLLVHEGSTYISAAPGLYRIEGDVRDLANASTISWGYSVHPGFFGHGMSGVAVGPDGRIYWSVGDMGFSLVAPDGTRHHYPREGAVLRSFPDGTGFEVFATGLRNTHEFDFDARGNLISVDNDGDHAGEMERVVYIVEGSDAGWRVNWQFGKYGEDDNNDYKVWMDESLFLPHFDGQAAYIVPPVANYHAGPAGMVYSPGTALNDDWDDHFFISEYTGTPTRTNIHAFRLEEDGAGFALAEDRLVVHGVLTVGIAFGPDGALYLADWIDGWDSKGAGRIWRLDAANPDSSERARTRVLLTDDYTTAAADVLSERLGYPDIRVRRKAQFELARRRDSATLVRAARNGRSEAVRLHGLWGIWQIALRSGREAQPLVALLSDGSAEIRAQAAKILGDVGYTRAADPLVPLLADASDRVRFFAAEALGKLEHHAAFDGIIMMLADNDSADVYLRHAGSLALSRLAEPSAIAALADHRSEQVRIAAVVALRRLRDASVTTFLDDASEAVVTEAARAINDDGGVEGALPDLAALLGTTPFDNEPLTRRVINANLRVGDAASARRLANFAISAVDTAMRAEAVAVLGVWPDPSFLDRVDGVHLDRVETDSDAATAPASTIVGPLLEDTSAAVRLASARMAERLRLEPAAPQLTERLRNEATVEVRRAALEALVALDAPNDEEVIRMALADTDPTVRMRAIELTSGADIDDAALSGLLESAIEGGSVEEVQAALEVLGEIGTDGARAVLSDKMAALEAGSANREVALDILEAAAASGSDTLAARVEAYRTARPHYSAALYGGDAGRGRSIYFNDEGAACTRCHSIRPGAETVGPNLRGIGSLLTREQLLESLVEPGARIAPGFGVAGGPSAMPDMSLFLTEREVRDVVAFLASQ